MRGTTPADVAAERQLTVVERLHVLLPRSRGFRGSADGSVGVYPASSHARHLPAARQEGSPRSKREPRSGRRRASVLRTHAPAAALRAAKHAERRGQAELRLQQLACKVAKVHLPAARQEGSPRSKREPRLGAEGKRAANARTRRSASRGEARRKAWAGGTPPAAARLQGGEGAPPCREAGRLSQIQA